MYCSRIAFKVEKAMNRKVNSIFSIIIGTLTLFLSAGKSNASILSATSLIQGVSGFTLNWDDLNSDGIIQVNEIPYPVISQPQFSGFNITNGPSWDVLYSYGIPDIPGITSGFGQNGYWYFDSSLSSGSLSVPVGVWDYSTFGSVPPSTLSFSGSLGSSSLPFLSGGSFSGIGELPSFNIDDLFLPGGVALTSGGVQFSNSSGQPLPSTITESYIRAIDPVIPRAGTPFRAEIGYSGLIFDPPPRSPDNPIRPPDPDDILTEGGCKLKGGIWVPEYNPFAFPPYGGYCYIYRFRYTNIGFISSLPSISIDLGSRVNFQLLSSEIAVILADGTSVTTSVTSANFSLSPQAVPEPTSILSLLALGTLGAASTLKRKLKLSKSTEKETTKVG
jgi:hypothetical protein